MSGCYFLITCRAPPNNVLDTVQGGGDAVADGPAQAPSKYGDNWFPWRAGGREGRTTERPLLPAAGAGDLGRVEGSGDDCRDQWPLLWAMRATA